MSEERTLVEETLSKTKDLIVRDLILRYTAGEPIDENSLDRIYQLTKDCSEKLSDQMLRIVLGNIVTHNLYAFFLGTEDKEALNLFLTFRKIYNCTGCNSSYLESAKDILDRFFITVPEEDELKKLESEFDIYKIT